MFNIQPGTGVGFHASKQIALGLGSFISISLLTSGIRQEFFLVGRNSEYVLTGRGTEYYIVGRNSEFILDNTTN